MKGYIFEYYEYIRYTKESLEDLKSVMNYEAADRSILTFGEYDRLKINPVEDFARYRDLSDLAKDWIGNRQSIFLYELEANPKFVFQYDEDGNGFWQKCVLEEGEGKAEKRDKHLFWALTEFPFRSTKREKMDYSKMLQSEISNLKQIINKKISDKGYEIEYEIFGTLGIFGIVVLWFGNQFTDILSIVNTIKAQSKRAFLSARTLFSKNPMYDRKKRNEKAIDAIKGRAFVQMTLKGYLEEDDKLPVLKNIEKKAVLHTPGEYDIMLEIKANDAYVLFENEDLFNHNQEKYQKNFLQTKVTLAKEIESIDNQGMQLADQKAIIEKSSNPNEQSKESMSNTLEKFNELCNEVRNKITEKMAKTSGLVDTMDSLICDYRSNVVSAVNENWAEDFAYTFGKNLECINELLDSNKASGDFLRILRNIMNNLKQQIFHITEANSLNLENPKCHLRYTGQEDGLLFCYMGIIKEILEIAYQLDSCNVQSEVVPIVTVDVVPIIESERYVDKSFYVNLYEKDQEFKILSLNLPHVSFYEIPVYFQYMYHEIFHYIVPEDREKRDYIIGVFSTIILVSRVLAMYFERELDSEKARKTIEHLLPLIYHSVVEQYFEIHKIVTTIDGIKKDRDVVLFIADVYVKEVIDYILDTDKHGFLDECIKNIGQKLNNAYLGISFEKLEKTIGDAEVKNKAQTLFEKGINKDIQRVLNTNLTKLQIAVYRLLDGLKEISADIPMIELSEMPLDEYLIFYSNCLKNNLIESRDLKRKKEVKERLRVGIILNYYYSNENWDEVENDFIYKYIAKYLVIPSDNEEMEKLDNRLQRLKSEAEDWIKFFRLCMNLIKREYGIFIRLFKDYVEVASIKARLHNRYDIKKNSDYYFKGYREAFAKYAEGIRRINGLPIDESENNPLEQYRKIKKTYEESMFIENIKLFQHFQVQKSLEELCQLNKKHNAEKEARKEVFQNPYDSNPFEGITSAVAQPPVITFTVKNFESFAREIKRITCSLRDSVKSIFGKSDLTVWYRGHENSAYGLIPSIMRKTTLNKKDFNYLAQYQRYQFGEFKFRADGAPEMKDRSHFSISDYLALMQHYDVYTNLMDWSEDAFTALYFALEGVMLNKEKQAHTDAALWVFSPQLYNDARKYMIQNNAAKEPCTEMVFKNSLKTVDGYDGMIPNISVEQNEKIYDMFLLGNVEYESPNKYGYRKKVTLSGHEEMAYLPLAVYTSRLNPRVRSQSGIFVAFNLYAEPSINDEYMYIGLEKVQEYYMKHSNRKNRKPFLYKIIIDRSCTREIADCLENMGINKSRIYPELSNIGDRVR